MRYWRLKSKHEEYWVALGKYQNVIENSRDTIAVVGQHLKCLLANVMLTKELTSIIIKRIY